MAEVKPPERFRILIIGRANAGKTSILRAVCGVEEEPKVYDQHGFEIVPEGVLEANNVDETHSLEARNAEDIFEAHHPGDDEPDQITSTSTRSGFRSTLRSIRAYIMCRDSNILASHQREVLDSAPSPRREPESILSPTSLRGEHRIDYELRFPSNPGFAFHDSRGFESGATKELELVRNFIKEKASLGSMRNQLHAIWYCFPADSNRLMTAAEQEFFDKIDTGSVPVIAIVTKFDALDADACSALCGPNLPFEVAKERAPQHATERFNRERLPLIKGLAHPPKAVVCLRNMHDRKSPAVIQKAASELIKSTESALNSDALKMLLIQAQHVNLELCMTGAVDHVGIKEAAQMVEAGADTLSQLQEGLVVKIFRWFPTIWQDFARAFINALTPLLSSLAAMTAPLQVLFVGITAVIIAADSFWLSPGNPDGQLVTISLAKYFESSRADHVRVAILEALHKVGGSYDHLDVAALQKIALNNHTASARPGPIAMSSHLT
ncbi:hypothetical protein BOTBODRAFT_39518 [Botryobasidium botryosum FD-172 SS1]|uniref:G domain-containing protein n=1 Tax=Botryobasidium botryosum (strain FD-172 SS1) TaxID=930990 RepID=A0A067LTC9_BOTB1|nr:hypothetical protein BOTBODRAFT_39518 [Botryobasidium botryosum FD-172 SS1]